MGRIEWTLQIVLLHGNIKTRFPCLFYSSPPPFPPPCWEKLLPPWQGKKRLGVAGCNTGTVFHSWLLRNGILLLKVAFPDLALISRRKSCPACWWSCAVLALLLRAGAKASRMEDFTATWFEQFCTHLGPKVRVTPQLFWPLSPRNSWLHAQSEQDVAPAADVEEKRLAGWINAGRADAHLNKPSARERKTMT